MTKHTPGPWHRNVKPATKYTTVWAGRNTHVARVVVDGLSEDVVEANIALVAAAPELLEALQSTEMALMGYLYQNDIVRAALSKARAAIRKATGEAE